MPQLSLLWPQLRLPGFPRHRWWDVGGQEEAAAAQSPITISGPLHMLHRPELEGQETMFCNVFISESCHMCLVCHATLCQLWL